ncbi:peptidase yqhT [Fusarium sp. NRRL 52700]|nr:peptidase yqhT [Fusarium sp. NRRL 52700]
MFEFAGCLHLAQGYETLDEVLTAKSATFTSRGPKIHDKERKWAQGVADLVDSLVGKRNAALGLERVNANVAIALKELGLSIVDAQQAIEIARTIKSPEEFQCIVAFLRAIEVAVDKLRDVVAPDLTENQLWSQRYVFQKNDLVALDTDIVGCHGYYSHFS